MLTFRDEIEPWERQPKESETSYKAFATYRDMQPRRLLREVAKVHHLTEKSTQKLSAKWRWVERSASYDRYLTKQTVAEHVNEVAEFRKRAALNARGKAQSLMLVDAAIVKRVKALTTKELEDMPLAQLLALSARCAQALPQVIKAEALALGDVTDRPATPTVPGDDDALMRKIQESDDLRSIAADLIQQATYGEGSGEDPSSGVRSAGEPGRVG